MKANILGYSVDIIEDFTFPRYIRQSFDGCYLDGKSEDPFYVCELSDIVDKHALWCQKLPRVEPFYAVKCNPDPLVVNILSSLNVGFDCASKSEISLALSTGVGPDRIIYANPCKQVSHIKFAESSNVRMLTFDSKAELQKISVYHPSALLILRIFTGATKALCPLGLKFGAQLEDVPNLLTEALRLNLNVIGVSFHVGSGCFDASAYDFAISRAYDVFQIANAMGLKFNLLDLGGGFPGNFDSVQNSELFDDVCCTINNSLSRFFPSEEIRVIAEPGRYYVSSAFQLACTVTSVRSSSNDTCDSAMDKFSYFLNDGVYGSFNCTVFDHYIGEHYLLSESSVNDNGLMYPSIFWGPTCDSADKILDNIMIRKIEIGEKIVFKNMGAYTIAAASNFNGFEKAYIKYVVKQGEWALFSNLLSEKIEQPTDDSLMEDLQVTTSAEFVPPIEVEAEFS